MGDKKSNTVFKKRFYTWRLCFLVIKQLSVECVSHHETTRNDTDASRRRDDSLTFLSLGSTKEPLLTNLAKLPFVTTGRWDRFGLLADRSTRDDGTITLGGVAARLARARARRCAAGVEGAVSRARLSGAWNNVLWWSQLCEIVY